MKPKLQEGLDKLEKLDPETYRHFREICAMTAFDYSPLDDPDITTPVYGWCLQGVIQKEIAARGWGICLLFHGRGRWGVHISGRDFPYIPDIYAETPAEAILLTYVAALEAKG